MSTVETFAKRITADYSHIRKPSSGEDYAWDGFFYFNQQERR